MKSLRIFQKNSPQFPNSVIIASEPLFADDWQKVPEQSMIKVSENLEIEIYQI